MDQSFDKCSMICFMDYLSFFAWEPSQLPAEFFVLPHAHCAIVFTSAVYNNS